MNSTLKAMKPYPMDELVKAKEKLKKAGKKIYDFGTGDPKEPTASFIREAVKDAIPEVSQYPTVKGRKDLRDAISNWLKRRFGVDVDSEREIIPTAGSKEAIFHFPLVFIDVESDKKRVIFGTPAYPVYERGTLFAQGIPTPYPLKYEEGFLLRLDKFKEDILKETRIVWLNYPHNPTGATASFSYFEEMYHICREYDIILCSDECYTEIYFDEKPPSALQVGKENLVVFHSLSKRSGMTGYRSGFVAGDKNIVQEYLRFRSSFGVASPEFIQIGAREAWKDEKHVEERREIFRRKKEIFERFFKEEEFDFLDVKASFYFWVKVPFGLSSMEYALHLLKYGIVVSPGEFFGQSGKGFFRIALVPSVDECKEAVKVWKEANKEILRR